MATLRKPDMELFTLKEVAELLKVSPMTVRRLQHGGQIAFIKVGGGLRFSKADIEAYLKKAHIEAWRR
jgi:excisionase family DNA binding protein